MYLVKLHDWYRDEKDSRVSFIGFQISKTVWSNQLNNIPVFMKIMATIMKFLGAFISIEKCGVIMSTLFTEKQEESLKKSGTFITWNKNEFVKIKEDDFIFDLEMQNRLWNTSLQLCKDEKTTQIAENLYNSSK